MFSGPYSILVLVGLIFLGLQLYVLLSIVKNSKGERWDFRKQADRAKALKLTKGKSAMIIVIHVRDVIKDESEIEVEIAVNTKVRVMRSTVVNVINKK